MKPHRIESIDDPVIPAGATLALVHPASPDKVKYVLNQSEGGQDGRSPWVWLRLPNGDLILGVFPQGDTYFAVEDDSAYPGM